MPTGGMADALWGIAQALHQERGGARAVLYARLALFLKPDLAEATLLIGDVFVDQQNFDAAIDTYAGIDDASPISFAGKLRIASALHQLDRKEQAFELLEGLVAAEPERIQALVQLGNLLRRDEDYARAEGAYSRAIERSARPSARTGPCSMPAASPMSGPSSGPRPRPISCRRSSSSRSSPSCSTISATAGSTWACASTRRATCWIARSRCGRTTASSSTAWAGFTIGWASTRRRSRAWSVRSSWSRATR